MHWFLLKLFNKIILIVIIVFLINKDLFSFFKDSQWSNISGLKFSKLGKNHAHKDAYIIKDGFVTKTY